MDQIKIGKFIAFCRKEGHMIQADLAEKLGISDRAVSKWETGRSMPDSGIMLELCALLHINVNELLSGERIMTESYDKRVEENLLAMRREIEQRDKRMLRLEMWLTVPTIVVGIILIVLAVLLAMPMWLRVALVTFTVAMVVVVGFIAVGIEQNAGYYECECCHHRCVPTYREVILAPHRGRDRYMRCQKCGKRCWQKKVLSDEDSEL